MEPADRKQLSSDTDLTIAAQGGDEHAFLQLYERHAPLAWRASLAITGVPAMAEATLVEGFAGAFTAIRSGRVAPETTFPTLVLTSVRNAAIDHRRERTDDDVATPFAHAAGDEDLETDVVAQAFGSLPERWRTVLWLTEVEGLRTRQTASVVGLVPKATATLAERARDGLREQYLQVHASRTESRNCARAVSRLGAHAAGVLSAADTEKLERHLSLCNTCTQRRQRLDRLALLLRHLTLPLPTGLAENTRTAWSAAVAEPARRTGTGLPAAAEKVLAGVAAFAAAVGVLGATMYNPSGGPGGGASTQAAAPLSSEGRDDRSVALAKPLDLSGSIPRPELDGRFGRPPTTFDRSSFGDATRRGSGGTRSSDTVIGASSPDGGATPARGVDGGGTPAPRTDDQAPTPSTAPSTTTPPPTTTTTTPAAKLSTTIADQPIAVEVGEEPGLTVGPISVGSEPTPDDETVAVDGPLAPLDPVVKPVTDAVDDTVDGLTRNLGL